MHTHSRKNLQLQHQIRIQFRPHILNFVFFPCVSFCSIYSLTRSQSVLSISLVGLVQQTICIRINILWISRKWLPISICKFLGGMPKAFGKDFCLIHFPFNALSPTFRMWCLQFLFFFLLLPWNSTNHTNTKRDTVFWNIVRFYYYWQRDGVLCFFSRFHSSHIEALYLSHSWLKAPH